MVEPTVDWTSCNYNCWVLKQPQKTPHIWPLHFVPFHSNRRKHLVWSCVCMVTVDPKMNSFKEEELWAALHKHITYIIITDGFFYSILIFVLTVKLFVLFGLPEYVVLEHPRTQCIWCAKINKFAPSIMLMTKVRSFTSKCLS